MCDLVVLFDFDIVFFLFCFADVDDLMPWSHPSPFLEAVATNSSAQTRKIKKGVFFVLCFDGLFTVCSALFCHT